MNKHTAYINACATLTGQMFKEVTMPFSDAPKFTRDFSEDLPDSYYHLLGGILRRMHEDTGWNVKCSKLTTDVKPGATLLIQLS